jgi:hypothetical protein
MNYPTPKGIGFPASDESLLQFSTGVNLGCPSPICFISPPPENPVPLGAGMNGGLVQKNFKVGAYIIMQG